MIVIGSNTQNENAVSGQIQIQIDSLQSAIDEINADIDTLTQTLSALQTSVNAQIDSETQTLLNTLNSQMSDLRTSLESTVSTNQITAVIGNLQQLAVTVSATISALTAGSINATTGITTANLTSTSSDIGTAQAASLSTGSLDATVATLGTVSASVLNVVTFIIENLTATNFSATNGAITNFETSLIKADTITGKQWHTPVSLPDNTELLRIRIPAYDGIVTFISEDGEVNVTIINNAFISYNQNVQYLYRIDSKTDYADLYLSNIDDTINYQVIYLGEGEHGTVTSEIVDKTGIQQNIETLKGITSISSKELNVELIFVQSLPEVGRENVIYLIETEGAFIWNEQEDKYYCFAGTVYQRKVLTDSVTVDEVEQTTVEGAIGALATLANSNKSLKQNKVLTNPVTANGMTATTVEGAIDALNAENKIIDGTLEVEEETYLDSDVVAEKNVTVKGDLIVNGTTYTTEEESLNTKADYVVLRENNPGGLGANEKSGIIVHNYSSNKSASLGVDKDGIFRISDNASEATATYTNVSQFNGSYYSGLTQDTPQAVSSGAVVAQDEDVLSDCVYYNGAYYHHSDKWFSVSLVSNVLTVGSEVTDETTLAALELLTKYELFYYRTLSVLTVQDSTNQPILTRSEAAELVDGAPLLWDATHNKAVKIAAPTSTDQVLGANGRTGAVMWTDQIEAVSTLPVSPDIQTRIYKCAGKYYIGDKTTQILQELNYAVDAVADGNMNPVTSNAVYDFTSMFSHNIPRYVLENGSQVLGKDITAYVTDGSLWKRLNGTDGFSLFEDIYVGDRIHMSRAITCPGSTDGTAGSDWVTIAGINTLQGNGDNISIDYNHLVMVPGNGEFGVQHFGRRAMNSSDTTVGGYKSTIMRTSVLGAVVSSGSTASGATINQQLYAEFGSHLKTIPELITTAINASGYNRFGAAGGCSSNWEWSSEQACLLSEVEAYGATVWSSSGFDTGSAKVQLPLFRFSTKALNNRSAWWWLKDVASAAGFCSVSDFGRANTSTAEDTTVYVRPRFVLAA